MESETPEPEVSAATPESAPSVAVAESSSEGSLAGSPVAEPSRVDKMKSLLRGDHSKLVAGLLIGGLATFSVTSTMAKGKVDAPVAAQLAQLRADVTELKSGSRTASSSEHASGEQPTKTSAADHETPNKNGKAPPWTYAEAKNWGELSDQYLACKEGKQQSPIALKTKGAQRFAGEIEFMYEPHAVSVVDNGHTVQVNAEGSGTLMMGEHEFKLLQFHVHLPSEHTIDGKLFELEVHLVHKDSDDKLAVVGVMVEEGAPLTDFDGLLNAVGGVNEEVDVDEPFDPASLLPETHDVLRYDGSLTTPPCSEDVSWNVMVETITMSKAQIEMLKEHLHEPNNRPLQNANGRETKMDIDLTH